jgi:tryptophan synthase alpha chain
MSYWNPIDKYGAERFSSELAEAGGAGCILPDLPALRPVGTRIEA